MNLDYKQNKSYGQELSDNNKMSARGRNVKERLELLKKSGIFPPAEILEVVSHEGLFLKMAKGKGFGVMGIEPNAHAASHARAEGIETIEGYFEEAFNKVAGRRFDVVALFHVLEHVPDYADCLSKIKSILKPGGWLVLEVPNGKSYRAKKYGNDWMYFYEEHLHDFSPERLKNELGRLGFNITNVYFRDFDCAHLSLRALLDRLLSFKFRGMNIKIRNQVKEDAPAGKNTESLGSEGRNTGFFLALFKNFLAFCVNVLKRGDFILIVAKIK
ncbi:MAG: class I SAM-dependent methyltransferase [Candidatus Pacebacteria bacterium]|nr:class I SAM-dependent methyltransferase [Candidatus Paceibacterota bacterium]